MFGVLDWNLELCHASLNECVGFLISLFEKDMQYENMIVLYLSYLRCSSYMYHHVNDNWPIGQYSYTCIMMSFEGSYIYDRLPFTMVSVFRFKRSERVSILNMDVFSLLSHLT